MLHHGRPYVRLHQLHGAREYAAHGVRDDADWLFRVCSRGHGRGHGLREAVGFVLDRLAPVVRERHHLVRAREEVGEPLVRHLDGSVGHHAIVATGFVCQVTEAVERAPAKPHAPVVHLEVAAEDTGQHEHRRFCWRGGAVGNWFCSSARAIRRFAGPRERADDAEARRCIHHQCVDDGFGCAIVAEVIEVRHLGALIEQERGAGRTRGAAVHAACLHHEVVVRPVERVGQHGLEPRRDGVALHVSGHHAELAVDLLVGLVQPLHEWAVGHLRGKAREDGRVGATTGDFINKVHQRGRDGNVRELERPLEHGQVRVQALGGEQRSARGARHAHHTLHRDAALLHLGHEAAQVALLRRVRRVGERVERFHLARAHPRHHLGHQSTA